MRQYAIVAVGSFVGSHCIACMIRLNVAHLVFHRLSTCSFYPVFIEKYFLYLCWLSQHSNNHIFHLFMYIPSLLLARLHIV